MVIACPRRGRLLEQRVVQLDAVRFYQTCEGKVMPRRNNVSESPVRDTVYLPVAQDHRKLGCPAERSNEVRNCFDSVHATNDTHDLCDKLRRKKRAKTLAIDRAKLTIMANPQTTTQNGVSTGRRAKRSPRQTALKETKNVVDLIFNPQATTERFLAVIEWAIASGKAKDDKDFGCTIGMRGNTIYHYSKLHQDGGRVIGPEYAATIKVRYNIPSDYIYCGDTNSLPDSFREFLSSKLIRSDELDSKQSLK